MPTNAPDPRQVHPCLYVGSLAARARSNDFDLVVDCLGATTASCGCPVVVVTPTGRTGHTWSAIDLGLIISEVVPVIEEGGTVLVHCRRGVSRSATAAAAVLLALGVVDDVDDALERARHPRRRPATSSEGSLKAWWVKRVATTPTCPSSEPEPLRR